MAHDRDHAVSSLVHHIDLLKRDVAELSQLSRGWQPNSRGRQQLQLLMKDLRQLEARATALLGEVKHMDSLRSHLTGEGSSAPRPQQRPAPPPPQPAAMETPTMQTPAMEPEFMETPLMETPPMEPERESQQDFQMLPHEEENTPGAFDENEGESTPPAPSESGTKRKLDSVVTGLPKHILDELRKAGME